MKLPYLAAFLICIVSTAFGEEKEDLPVLETVQEEAEYPVKEFEPTSTSNIYFKFETSIIYQGVGFGKRFRDLSENRGNDFAVNIKVIPITLLAYTIPSIEYTRLFYKQAAENASYYKYSGVGLEAGILLRKHGKFTFIPNPKVVWGKEYRNGRFSQWSVNLIPTMLFAAGIWSLTQHKHCCCGLEYGIAAIGLSCMFEYSVGF